MIIETTYSIDDLRHGICKRCGEESHEIDTRTGWCIDCIEEERFYQESMRMVNSLSKTFKDW